jgi:hypothetical protein
VTDRRGNHGDTEYTETKARRRNGERMKERCRGLAER